MTKIAVILFNLGGPDSQEAVRPFLYNLFNDAAIIRLPWPLRSLIAKLISSRRAPVARAIYQKLGGGSPILPNTLAQAEALDAVLNQSAKTGTRYKSFIAMRYWHPFAAQAVRDVKTFAPDKIILLPLYPQFSTTTTASSFDSWRKEARRAGMNTPTQSIGCYPREPGFITAMAASIRVAYDEAATYGKPRVLFSAHGLPQKIVDAGDPYPAHCEMTVTALRQALDIQDLDSVLCYQSRVGPLQWIKPSTDDEVMRAGQDKVPLVVAPIAFVSDHSETLVEIDMEYRALAQKQGVPFFASVPAVGTAAAFIDGLARMVFETSEGDVFQNGVCRSGENKILCPVDMTCACRMTE
jgi:ferrochelatase